MIFLLCTKPNAAYNEHAVVRAHAGHAKHCRFQVLLVTGQVDKCDNLSRMSTYGLPIECLADATGSARRLLVHHFAVGVESKNVVANAARSARLDLVLVSKLCTKIP